MTKIIEMSLDENNKLILKCGEVCKQIDDFTLSARDIYELLDYRYGDSYDIKNNIDEKKDVIKPIEELFNKIFEGIKTIQDPIIMVEEDICQIKIED